jgi:hypothetical protein
MDNVLQLFKSGRPEDEKLAFNLLEAKDKRYLKSLAAELKRGNFQLYIIEKVEERSRVVS